MQRFFCSTPRHEELAVERGFVGVFGGVDVHLFEPGQGLKRFRATHGRVHRQDTPARDFKAFAHEFVCEHLAGPLCLGSIRTEENVAGRKDQSHGDSGFPGGGLQERFGLFQHEAAPIAGLAVGSDGTAVGEAGQRLDGGLDEPVAGLVVDVGDEAEAAAVLLVRGPVQANVWPVQSGRVGRFSSGTRHGSPFS